MNKRAFLKIAATLGVAVVFPVVAQEKKFKFNPSAEYGFAVEIVGPGSSVFQEHTYSFLKSDARRWLPQGQVCEIRRRLTDFGCSDSVAWYYNKYLKHATSTPGLDVLGGYYLVERFTT